jgi:hypothetical protein
MNDFFVSGPARMRPWEPMARAYARIEDAEPDANGELVYRFSLVDAAWIDEQDELEPGAALLVTMPIAVLDTPNHPGGQNTIDHAQESGHLDYAGMRPDTAPGWYELTLTFGPKSQCVYFSNLYQPEGTPVVVAFASLGNTPTTARLNRMFATTYLDTASAQEHLLRRLATLRPIDRALVLDVGQGGATALIEEGEHDAAFFFDYGRSVLQHTATFPPGFAAPCRKDDAFVIASHWDWDHWALGKFDPAALDMDWFFPYEAALFGVHASFAAALHAKGHLYMLPPGFTSVMTGQLQLEAGSGTTRNDRGLVLTVHTPIAAARERWLLPADALYRHIASCAGTVYDAVVIPHHGARDAGLDVPLAASLSGLAVVSVGGPKNYYRHPQRTSLDAHTAAGFTVCNTAVRTAHAPHHVRLAFGQGVPWLPCNHPDCAYLNSV